jgi:O-antigen/teichoic acid export membrane protein
VTAISATQPARVAAPGKKVIGNIAVLGGGQAVTWTLTALWTVIVPRQVGPAGMGLIVMAWSVSGVLFAIAGLGTRPLLVKEIAANPERAPALLGTALIVRLLFVVPSAVATELYVVFGRFTGQRALVLYLAFGVAMFLLLVEPMLAAFQAAERMKYLAYSDVIYKLGMTVGGIALVLLGFRALGVVAVMLAAAAAAFAVTTRWFVSSFAIEWRTSLVAVRSFLAKSVSYSAYIIFLTIYLWIDSLILAVMTSPTVVGYYGVPTKVFGTLLVVPLILSTVWLPRLAVAFGRGHLREAAATPVQLVVALSLPIAVGAALVVGPVIQLLYGPRFAPSEPVAVILALTTIPMSINIIVCQVVIACNRQMTWTIALAGATVVNPILNVVLIRYFQAHDGNGAIGAAWSLLLTELVMAGYGLWVAREFLDWGHFDRVFRGIPATLGMAIIAIGLSRFGLAIEVLGGTLSFAAFALAFRVIAPSEVKTALAFLPRRRLGTVTEPATT